MALVNPSSTMTEIVTTTLRNRTGKLADNISKNNALLNRLKKRGKIKTVMQFVAITFALMPLSALWGQPMDIVNTVLMSLVVIITLVTGADYLIDGVRQQRKLAAAVPNSAGTNSRRGAK